MLCRGHRGVSIGSIGCNDQLGCIFACLPRVDAKSTLVEGLIFVNDCDSDARNSSLFSQLLARVQETLQRLGTAFLEDS